MLPPKLHRYPQDTPRQPGTRTDLGKRPKGTKLAPSPRDPLYFETATTLPVDFHSFRRAFSTALAEAGVNVQHAMHLAAHSDPRVHARYVMRTAAMRSVPAAALPALSALAFGDRAEGDDSNGALAIHTPIKTTASTEVVVGIVTSRDDSPPTGEPTRVDVPRKSATCREITSSGCWTRIGKKRQTPAEFKATRVNSTLRELT
jgi:hypothetical protein